MENEAINNGKCSNKKWEMKQEKWGVQRQTMGNTAINVAELNRL